MVLRKKIIDELKKNTELTQEQLSKLVGISVVNIKKNMKKLQDLGLLTRIGSDKTGKW